MTAQRSVHILQPHVFSLIAGLPGAPFQQDNPRPYTARVSQFDQTRGIPNWQSEMIPDMLHWRRIWGSGRPKKDINNTETVL
ncbi:hypothetical protein TNCV_496261 [Trichonephila clavipes]|nr:hypothetical protein TNCV_496261 [Trichonephila clavipes]